MLSLAKKRYPRSFGGAREGGELTGSRSPPRCLAGKRDGRESGGGRGEVRMRASGGH